MGSWPAGPDPDAKTECRASRVSRRPPTPPGWLRQTQRPQGRPPSSKAKPVLCHHPHFRICLLTVCLPALGAGGGLGGGAEGGKAWERPAWGPPAGLTLWQPQGAQTTGHSWYSPRLPRPCQGHPRRGSPRSLSPPPPPAANPRVTVPPAGVVPLSDVSFTPAKDTGIDRS